MEALTPTAALEALRTVIDPEIGIDIVDLGLVRDVAIDSHELRITMTMTTPACPLGAMIKRDVQEALGPLAEGRAIHVAIVFDPPWSPDAMSDAGRRRLGLA